MAIPTPTEFDAMKRREAAETGCPVPRMFHSPLAHAIESGQVMHRPTIAVAFLDDTHAQIAAKGRPTEIVKVGKLRRKMMETAKRLSPIGEAPRLVVGSNLDLRRVAGLLGPQGPEDFSVAATWATWWRERSYMLGTGAVMVVPRVLAARWYLSNEKVERDVNVWARALGVTSIPPAEILLGLHDRAADGPCLASSIVGFDTDALGFAKANPTAQITMIGLLKNRTAHTDRWNAALIADPVYVERARCEGKAVYATPVRRHGTGMILDCGDAPVRLKVGPVLIKVFDETIEGKLTELGYDPVRGIVMTLAGKKVKGEPAGSTPFMTLLDRAYAASEVVVVTPNAFLGSKIDTVVHSWTGARRPAADPRPNMPLDVAIAGEAS